MAQDVGTVYVQVEPSGKGFGRKIEGDIAPSIDKVAKSGSTSLLTRIGGAFGTIGKVGLGAIGTITGGIVGLAAKGGFSRALAIENAQAKLKGLGHDAGDVSEIMNDALSAVKGTAFGLGDAATVAASLSAAGVKSGEQMTRVLKSVADTAQISGRSLTDIGTIFGSVAAKGKLQGDDMLQLMQSGIPVLQLLGKHLGKTSAEVSKMVSGGQVDFQTFADAMQEGIGGAALAAGGTFEGAVANMKAAMGRLGADFQSPVLNALRDTLNQLNPAIDAVAKQLKPFADAFASRIGPAVKQAGDWLSKFTDDLNGGRTSIADLAGKLASLVGGFGLLAGAGGAAKPLIDMFGKLGKAGDSETKKLTDSIDKLSTGLSAGAEAGGKSIGDLTGKLEEAPSRLKGAMGGFSQFKGYFNRDIREAMSIDGDPFANALTRVGKGLDGLSAPFKSFGSKLAGTNIGGGIAKLGSGIGSGFGQLTAAAGSNIKAFSSKMGSGFSGAFDKLGGSKLGQSFTALSGKVQSAFGNLSSSLGNVFGGLGDMVAPSLQSGLGKVGSLIGGFFSPANFLKFFGIGAIIAALVAGIGLLNQAMGGKLDDTIKDLASKAPAMIGQLTAKILAALPEVMASGTSVIVSLLNGITKAGPSLIAGAMQIISALVAGLGQAAPQIIPAALGMVMTLLTSLVQQLPTIVSAGMQLLKGIVQGIVAALPQLVKAIPSLVNALLTSLTTMLPLIMTGGTNILFGLIQGLVATLPTLVAQIPTIINSIINALTTSLPRIIQTGIRVLLSLIDGIVNAIPTLVAQIPVIIASLVTAFFTNLPKIIDAGMRIIGSLAMGLLRAIPKILRSIPQIIKGIRDGFGKVDWGQVGKNIINGIRDGIVHFASNLWNAAKDAAKGALDGVKNFLGIHSPSRVFRDQVGLMIGRGIAKGISDSKRLVSASLDDVAEGLTLDGRTFGMPTVLPDVSDQRHGMPGNGAPLTQYISTMDPMAAAREATRLVGIANGRS